jgi:hypothetical protein
MKFQVSYSFFFFFFLIQEEMEDLNDRDGEGQFARVIAEKMLGHRCHVVFGRFIGVTAFHAVADKRSTKLAEAPYSLAVERLHFIASFDFRDRCSRPVTKSFLFCFYSAQAHFLLDSIGDSYA